MPYEIDQSKAKMDVRPDGNVNHYRLKFGRLTIEWTLPKDIPPITVGINWGKFGKENDLITLCDITYTRGKFSFTVTGGYEFDGASIPWFLRWAPGYERIGPHIWAVILHDWVCAHPEDLPRIVGDAWFITILLDTGVRTRQSKAMYHAVRWWSTYRAWKMDDEVEEHELSTNPIARAVKESEQAPPVEKAAAVSEAAEVAKAETTVAPPKQPEAESKP